MNRTLRILLLLCLAVAAPLAAKDKFPLEITVYAPDGKPAAGVELNVTAATGEAFKASGTTDNLGQWRIGLPDFDRVFLLRTAKDDRFDASEQSLDFKAKGIKEGMTAQVSVTVPAKRGPTPEEIYNEGVKALQAGQNDEAIAKFSAAVQAKPELWQGWSALALVQATGKHWDEALAAADKALAIEAGDIGALRTRYEALAAKKDPAADAALDALAKTDKSPDTATLLFNAGVAAMTAEKYDLAEQRFRSAVEMNPQLSMGHIALAELRVREKKFEDAIKELDAAIAVAPRNFKAHERKIEILKALKDDKRVKAAEDAYAKAKAGGS